MLLALEGLNAGIVLEDCPEILEALSKVLGTWPFSVQPRSSLGPAIRIRCSQSRYLISSPWLSEPLEEKTQTGAVFSVTAEIGRAFSEEHPEILCLHSAAVNIGGSLVLFPSEEGSGKSTLSAQFACRGYCIHADDILPISISDGTGIALGLAPRLRRTPAVISTPEMERLISEYKGPYDNEFIYLDLPTHLLASHGTSAPVGAIVLLERSEQGVLRLTDVSRGEALRRLLIQNFSPHGLSQKSTEVLHYLIAQLPTFKLSYSDGESAIHLLTTRLIDNADHRNGTYGTAGTIEVVLPDEAASRRRAFIQNANVAAYQLDDQLFLARAGNEDVLHLNELACSLWELLEYPTSETTAVRLVAAAFPQVAKRRIKRDVRKTFDTFRESGVIVPVP